jgi:hypothetical protein
MTAPNGITVAVVLPFALLRLVQAHTFIRRYSSRGRGFVSGLWLALESSVRRLCHGHVVGVCGVKLTSH